ncbi:MAG: MFS transporter [Candidatus Aenigmarchaeota archaeon]|nr:MFS transporter [Candidatus Aenigmarchaeota archaeon]
MRRTFYILLVAVFASQLTIGVVNVILPLYFRSLKMDMTNLNLIFTVFEFTLLFAMAFIGKISDVIGRKYIVAFSLLLHTIVSYLNVVSTKILEFAVLRAIRSFATVTDNVVAPAYVADIFRNGRGMKIGFLNAFRHSGVAIGGLIGGVIFGLLGFKYAFYLTSGITFMVFLFSVTLMKEPVKEIPKVNFNRNLSKDLIRLALVSVIIWAGVRAITPTLFPVYISEVFHQSPAIVGLIIGVGTLGFSLFNIVGGKMIHSLGIKKTTLISISIYAVASLMLYFSNNLILSSILFFIVMSAFGLSNTGFSTWSVLLSRDHKRAQDIGIYRMIAGIGAIPGLLISGLLADFFGFKSVFLFAAIVFIASLVSTKIFLQDVKTV